MATLLAVSLSVRAQGFITQHIFTNTPDGANPGQLVWTNGLFYGNTSGGGTNSSGAIFSYNTNGPVFTPLYSFAGSTNGSSPNNVLVTASAIYGTSQNGGTNGVGMIFSMGTDGTGFNNLYSFGASPDGQYPVCGLILSGVTLYGATHVGGTGIGANSGGIIFKINTDGTGYTPLHSFTNTPDGYQPQSELLLSGSTLYGTTTYGGTNGNGTVFAINTNGTGLVILHSFTNSPEPTFPYGKLVLSAGVLYGTGSGGGTNGTGGIFAINTDGSGFRTLHSFSGFSGNTDGRVPKASLSLSGSCLYGTTISGGSANGGTLFLINTNGTGFTVIRSFTNNTAAGWAPIGGAIRVGNSVWGTAYLGAGGTFGTLYQLPMPAITLQPQNLTVTNTSPATFTINAADDSPVSYQWYFNTNTLLAGQNTNTLTLASATNNNAGTYTAVVSDGFGSITSSPAVLSVVVPGIPPTVTNQPKNFTTPAGGTASFTNGASGTAPLFYQWYFNTNTLIGGATSPIYIIPSATTNQAGYYSVVVSNTYGMATSAPALLSVGYAPVITNQAADLTVTNGFNAAFTNIASGTDPLFYQWFYNTNTPVSSGVNNTIFTLTPATTGNAGYYTVIVTNLYGSATSAPARLTVIVPGTKPAITLNAADITVTNGFNAAFTNVASGTDPLFYRWYFNTNTLVSSGVNDTNFTLTPATTNQAGYYTVIVTNLYGGATSAPAKLTVIVPAVKPTITQNPVDVTVTNGYDASFTNAASGTGPLFYQWYFNTNTAVPGGTNAILVVSFPDTNDIGSYRVIVTNVAGSATSSPARLTLIATKPIIFIQPQSITVTNGDPFSFTVVAAGQPPLKYSWYTNLVSNLFLQAGQTNSTATFPAASNKFAGKYIVVITNALGKTTSSPAILTVLTKPVITLDPQNVVVTNGNPVTFTADATGAGLLKFQWYFRTNTILAGATNTSLTFTNATTNLAGYYAVRVTNSFGSVTSAYALLIISNRPNLLSFTFSPGDGSFSLAYANLIGSTNRLLASTNLASTNFWNAIATNVMATNGLWFFTDPGTARTNAMRFYRFTSP